jgi:hypothetical protein
MAGMFKIVEGVVSIHGRDGGNIVMQLTFSRYPRYPLSLGLFRLSPSFRKSHSSEESL